MWGSGIVDARHVEEHQASMQVNRSLRLSFYRKALAQLMGPARPVVEDVARQERSDGAAQERMLRLGEEVRNEVSGVERLYGADEEVPETQS